MAVTHRAGGDRAGARTVWLFGLHAVAKALQNPVRVKLRLVVTRNAVGRLGAALEGCTLEPEIADPRRFPAPLDAGSVHQGAALLVRPLDWGSLDDVALDDVAAGSATRTGTAAPRLVVLDRVSDPHNAGAVLRSSLVLGARGVIVPRRHAVPETGALAKAASGALECQPYLRVGNLGQALDRLAALGYVCVGFDAHATQTLGACALECAHRPVALVFGAEGAGLRRRTRALCHKLVRIEAPGAFGSLNVSNAVAVGLYALGGDGRA